jgi:uncharacterized protein YqhQ
MAQGIGGRAKTNGIVFVTDSYSIEFDAINEEKAQIYLQKNEGAGKKALQLPDVPILRDIELLVNNNYGYFLFLLVVQFIGEIRIRTHSGPIPNESNPIASIIGKCLPFILFLLMAWQNKINLTKLDKLWKFHGCEHKIINSYVNGLSLTYENCLNSNRVSSTCGTMFAAITAIISLLNCVILMILPINIFYSVQTLLILIISVELFLADRNNKILKPIFELGYWAQEKLFTKEPEEYQLKQGMEAFRILMEAQEGTLSNEELNELLSKEGKEITVS